MPRCLERTGGYVDPEVRPLRNIFRELRQNGLIDRSVAKVGGDHTRGWDFEANRYLPATEKIIIALGLHRILVPELRVTLTEPPARKSLDKMVRMWSFP